MGAREMARSWRHACAWSFSRHCQRAVVHAVPGLVVRRWQGGPVCEPQLPLGPIAADPHDAVAAHDRVHRIGLARERLGVRARNLRAGEVIEAALASRMAVDHPHRAHPARVFARLPRSGLSGPDLCLRGRRAARTPPTRGLRRSCSPLTRWTTRHTGTRDSAAPDPKRPARASSWTLRSQRRRPRGAARAGPSRPPSRARRGGARPSRAWCSWPCPIRTPRAIRPAAESRTAAPSRCSTPGRTGEMSTGGRDRMSRSLPAFDAR